MPHEELEPEEQELLEREKEMERELTKDSGENIDSSDIEFYELDSDVLQNRRHLERLREAGLEPGKDFNASLMHATFGNNTPEDIEWELGIEMYDLALAKLRDFADRELSAGHGKLDLLNAAWNAEHDDYHITGPLWDYFSEDGLDAEQSEISDIIEEGKVPTVTDEFMKEYWDDLGEEFWTGSEYLTKAFALDTVKSLQREAMKKDDTEAYAEQVRQFEHFFSRASPANQGRLEPSSSYTAAPVETREGMKSLGLELRGSCLFSSPDKYGFESEKEMFHDHPLEAGFMMWHEDPGTFYHAIGKNGDLKGYIRSFILEDSDGDLFAGIDTIEVAKSGGLDIKDVDEDFWDQSDIISAGVYGAIPYFFSLGVEYVAGRDARVKYGPRQSYGNTRKPTEYRKVGDTVPYYSAYKGDDWDGAGWLGFNKPEEADIRGFRTEPGWHETSNAYILMEDPKNLPESPTM